MKIEEVNGWADLVSAKTKSSGSFVGVAIGPDSEAGVVLVDGLRLQAGRVLPLRSSSYALTRADGVAGSFSSVRRLQLMLFECAGELACSVARPNVPYFAKGAAYGDGAGTYATVLTAPFAGRTTALVRLGNVSHESAVIDYQIIGRKWCGASQTVRETTLRDSVTGSGASIAVYVGGGGDEAESWSEIVVKVRNGAAGVARTLDAEIECFGEIGL